MCYTMAEKELMRTLSKFVTGEGKLRVVGSNYVDDGSGTSGGDRMCDIYIRDF